MLAPYYNEDHPRNASIPSSEETVFYIPFVLFQMR